MSAINTALLHLITSLRGSLARSEGQTLAEYGVIITVISVGVVVLGMIVFRDALAAAFDSVGDCLDGSC